MKCFLLVFFALSLAGQLSGQDFRVEQRAYADLTTTQFGALPQTRPAHTPKSRRAIPVRGATPHYARLSFGIPNPYRPGTPIACSQLPAGRYALELYDPRGQRVWSRNLSAELPVVFPEDMPPGSYLVKIHADGRPLLCERVEVLPIENNLAGLL